MKIINIEQAKKIEFVNSSVALGTFDGLHLGHLALIDELKSYPGTSVVFTFDSLPIDLFNEDHVPMRIFTIEEKTAAFENSGIDFLCMTSFNKKFADMEKTAFTTLLQEVFSPKNVIAGFNYAYGKDARGNVETLIESGNKLGYNVDVIPPVIFEGEPISSSRIRECISSGYIDTANTLLGYKYKVCGIVNKGKEIGRSLGFPTANIKIAKEKIIPKSGVYSVEVLIGKDKYKGVCNIGVNPTISKDNRQTIEIHIVSLSHDIYDETIDVSFVRRLRDERKFENLEELKEQIADDISNI